MGVGSGLEHSFIFTDFWLSCESLNKTACIYRTAHVRTEPWSETGIWPEISIVKTNLRIYVPPLTLYKDF